MQLSPALTYCSLRAAQPRCMSLGNLMQPSSASSMSAFTNSKAAGAVLVSKGQDHFLPTIEILRRVAPARSLLTIQSPHVQNRFHTHLLSETRWLVASDKVCQSPHTSAMATAALRGTMLAQMLRGTSHSAPWQSACSRSCPSRGENRTPDAFAACTALQTQRAYSAIRRKNLQFDKAVQDTSALNRGATLLLGRAQEEHLIMCA